MESLSPRGSGALFAYLRSPMCFLLLAIVLMLMGMAGARALATANCNAPELASASFTSVVGRYQP